MKVSGSVIPAQVWAKSHQTPLLVFLASVVLAALAGWYYVGAFQQESRLAPERADQVITTPTPPATPSQDASASSTSVQSITQNNGSSPVTTTRTRINGQQVQVPQTGTVHKVIQNPSGTTTVDISVDNNTSGNTSSDSSTSIELNSTSEVNSSSESSQ
ncbi:hypothetical protein H7X68_01695 [Candidatus Saccharibacteria bacterium]|nr:hypothetical protein [Candidatus Saccharibacteria bacterium]